MANFEEQLDLHLDEGYGDDPDFVFYIHRVVRVGRVTCEGALDMIHHFEDVHDARDRRLLNEEEQAAEDMDRVFYPGDIGGVAVHISSLEWE